MERSDLRQPRRLPVPRHARARRSLPAASRLRGGEPAHLRPPRSRRRGAARRDVHPRDRPAPRDRRGRAPRLQRTVRRAAHAPRDRGAGGHDAAPRRPALRVAPARGMERARRRGQRHRDAARAGLRSGVHHGALLGRDMRQRDGGTVEYHVTHPRWRTWTVDAAEVHGDLADLYGAPLGDVLRRAPDPPSSPRARASKSTCRPGCGSERAPIESDVEARGPLRRPWRHARGSSYTIRQETEAVAST